MQDGHLHLPRDYELMNEMNAERYELSKTGQLQFSHVGGTHDDRLWALALAVYASRFEIPEYHPVAAVGRNPNYVGPSFNWRKLRPGASVYRQLPGEPAGLYRAGHVWCLACRQPMLTRPHKCQKPPS